MKTRLTALTAMMVAISMFLLIPLQASAVQHPMKNINVTGKADGGGTFEGKFDIQRFVEKNGRIFAVGSLSGNLRDSAGKNQRVNNKQVEMPVKASSSGAQAVNQSTASTGRVCPILNLVLGPLDLDLLGLTVHLDQVVLDINAESGPGKLLGNLLCQIADLLNGGGALGQIIDLLNQILAKLG